MAAQRTRPTVHLLCNSHLDPVWLWEWPEGAAEALSLARTVCDLLEEHETFVFNRNEVQFHAWIEEYDPPLFDRIRKLVAEDRWHVTGGWYLQPDCNLPSGESFVRQILVGRRYFADRFGVTPTVAANVDSFGHSRGLVQILVKSGYDAYLFCRPKRDEGSTPAAEFTWVGFDGSEVTAALAESHYNSGPGGAADKIREWIERDAGKVVRQVPWGVGDHGGGPSRGDLADISALAARATDVDLVHSTPEAYFADLRARGDDLVRHAGDLNPWSVGCYTSAMRLKAGHRRLENGLFLAEKMATTAWAQGRMEYPADELDQATRAMLATEFHDILGGTSIPSGEETALDELGHGLTLARRVTTRAFFALAEGQERGREGVHAILVYNPHPFAVRGVVECEVQPAWPDHPRDFGVPSVTSGGAALPAQAEKEESNIDEDHRKRVAFLATLQPGRMNRFDCRFEKVVKRPAGDARLRGGRLRFRTEDLEVELNGETGLMDRFRVGGIDFLEVGAVGFRLMLDDADPWAMNVKSFRKSAGRARLMTPEKAARFAGVGVATLAPVRVLEDGPVRVVVEALFSCGASTLCQRYKLPREGTEVEVEVRVHWQEKDRMLKLCLPTPWPAGTLRGQVAYGAQELPSSGEEVVAQKWLAVLSDDGRHALTVVNDATYGCDFCEGELRLSLLRGPAHAAHPTGPDRPIVRQDRPTPRVDRGEHVFRFWLDGGPRDERLTRVDREALAHAEKPLALAYWPPGGGTLPEPGPVLDDPAVQLGAFKKAEDGDELIVRLFEPTGEARSTTLSLPHLELEHAVHLDAFEIRTLAVDPGSRRVREVNLVEEG